MLRLKAGLLSVAALLSLMACGGKSQVTIHGQLERGDINGGVQCASTATEWLDWYLGARSITFMGPDGGQAIGSATSGTSVSTQVQGTGCLGDAPFQISLPQQDLYQAVVHLSSGDQTFSISSDELSNSNDQWTIRVS